MTGVYGMWNIYVLGLLFLYAPSHKQWTTSQTSESANTLNDGSVASEDVVRTGEEIEFSVSSITGAANKLSFWLKTNGFKSHYNSHI